MWDRSAVWRAPPHEVETIPSQPMARPDIMDRRFKELAELITDGNPAGDWLIGGLKKAVAGLCWTIQKDTGHPAREALRAQLEEYLERQRCARWAD